MIVRFRCLEEQKKNNSTAAQTRIHTHTKKKKRTLWNDH